MSVVGYARVSTTDQDLAVQLEQLAAAGVERVFQEKVSGSSQHNRPELANCLEWLREGDQLVVTRLDRLARSIIDLRDILSKLEAKKVSFRCISQHMDTTTSEGRLMLNILGSFAEFENDIRRERQREGIEKAKRKGVYRKGPLKVTKAEILALQAEGLGATEIGRRLGVHKATVYRHVPDGWSGAPLPQTAQSS